MRWLLLLFVTSTVTAQIPYTNDPDRVYPLIADFVLEAEMRGVDAIPLMAGIDSIIVTKNQLTEYRWVGEIETIELQIEDFDEPWKIQRKFTHEMGHAGKLIHCIYCSLHIMSEIFWASKYAIQSNPSQKKRFYDRFFYDLQRVEAFNAGHEHY